MTGGQATTSRLLGVLLVAVALAPVAGAQNGVVFFRTPSGNIGCVYGPAESGFPASIRCDIRSGLRPKPPRPAGCTLEYGDSYALRKTGRATLVCHGDTVFDPHAPVLAYGRTWARDGFRCASRTTGLRCSNSAGHGFFLSRERSFRF